MSMGGDFYALSDDQLQRMLEGSLDYAEFLYGEIEEKPRECYSRGEHLWYELTRLLQNEDACGMEQTDAIPEFSGYSVSGDVASTAKRLTALSEDQIRHRHDDENIEAPIDEVLDIVKGVVEFYARAAANGDAVLFRVT